MNGLDLYQSQGELVLMLLCALRVGLGLGMLADILRALRLLWMGHHPPVGHKRMYRLYRVLEDTAFVLTAWVAVILLVYYTNDGVFRAPIIFGLAVGFFAYRLVISPLTFRLEMALARPVRSAAGRCLRLLSRPVRWGLRYLCCLVCWLWRRTAGRFLTWVRSRREERREREAAKNDTRPPHGTTVFSTRTLP